MYLALEASLTVLEVLVNLDLPPDLMPEDYVLMQADLSPLWERLGERAVEDARNVSTSLPSARAFGDRWLAEARTPCLRVASHILPEVSNLLLNPGHPAASSIKQPTQRAFEFDPRLF